MGLDLGLAIQVVFLEGSPTIPGNEEPSFAIITIVGHVHLGPNENDLPVEHENATVVTDILMHDGSPNVHEHVFREVFWVVEDFAYDLPRVRKSVLLQKVILTTVPYTCTTTP